MDLQAYFSDIRTIIAEELDVATESVVAAVAWLGYDNDSFIFGP